MVSKFFILWLMANVGSWFGHAAPVDGKDEGTAFSVDNEQRAADELQDELSRALAKMYIDQLNPRNLSLAMVQSVETMMRISNNLNLSLEIFNDRPSSDLDEMTEFIRIEACKIHHGESDVQCPPPTDLKQCYYQINKPLKGYAGLQCRTQCDIMRCSEVPQDEIVEEENSDDSLQGAEKQRTRREVKSENKLEHEIAIKSALSVIRENMYLEAGQMKVNVTGIAPDEDTDLKVLEAIKETFSSKFMTEDNGKEEEFEEENVPDILESANDGKIDEAVSDILASPVGEK